MGDLDTRATTDRAALAAVDGAPIVSEFAGTDAAVMLLVETRSQIIDLMASGAPLAETLDAIARAVERVASPAMCSILLLRSDGKHLRSATAPSLPQAFTAAVDGLAIGPDVGSCGAAAYLKKPVIVTDIATDPKWAPARDFALSFGLRACWSMPVVRHDGVVLGTIAMYYNAPRAPSARDWGLLEPFARLVRLALAQARREDDLRTSEARWQLASESSGVGTYDADLISGVSVWSPLLRSILGVRDDAVAGLDLLVSCMHPDERERFLADATSRISLTREVAFADSYRIIRPIDGQERIIAMRGRRLKNADGVLARVIGTIADITEQRNHETDLAAARDEAERANHAKSDFLASMSHELRTPLNAIIGFSDLIRQCTLGPISPAKYREYADDIYTSGNHLLSLINDVLDMAKIEAGKRDLHLKEVSVAKIADDALRFVEPQANAGTLRLNAQIDRGITLIADERALTQVLVNLLSNAVKFTKSGGAVTVFGKRTANGGVAIGVEDTGIGMTPEGLAKALEQFGQVEERFTVEGRGTGLGLPLVKALVQSHGAEFRIETAPGKGTRAWAEFPPSAVVASRAVA